MATAAGAGIIYSGPLNTSLTITPGGTRRTHKTSSVPLGGKGHSLGLSVSFDPFRAVNRGSAAIFATTRHGLNFATSATAGGPKGSIAPKRFASAQDLERCGRPPQFIRRPPRQILGHEVVFVRQIRQRPTGFRWLLVQERVGHAQRVASNVVERDRQRLPGQEHTDRLGVQHGLRRPINAGQEIPTVAVPEPSTMAMARSRPVRSVSWPGQCRAAATVSKTAEGSEAVN